MAAYVYYDCQTCIRRGECSKKEKVRQETSAIRDIGEYAENIDVNIECREYAQDKDVPLF